MDNLNRQQRRQLKRTMDKKSPGQFEAMQQGAKLEGMLNEDVSVTFMRRELVVVHNILASMEYKLGDARIILGIMDKIAPHTDVLKQAPNEGVVNLGQRADLAEQEMRRARENANHVTEPILTGVSPTKKTEELN